MKGLRRRAAASRPPARRAANHWEALSELFAAIGGPRPHYTWSLIHAALVAHRLGVSEVSALEIGVAGGSGLVALEEAAGAVAQQVGTGIAVHGFDTGTGLPAPVDYRDAPYLIGQGDFAMDETALRARLKTTELHLGPVATTIPRFLGAHHPPVGFVAFDLDYYSSTRDALTLVAGPPECLMPRFLMYFDDVLGYPWGYTNGPRPAIAEFNARRGATRLVDELVGLRYMVPSTESQARWPEAMFLAHVLDHPLYGEPEETAFSHQLGLD